MTCEIVRTFNVLPNQIETFESTYGPEGPWVRLFRHVPSYKRTKLIADLTQSGRYITIDEWTSHAAFLEFRRDHADAFAALDAACAPLLIGEAFFGAFRVVSA